jgi:hypothetical protein
MIPVMKILTIPEKDLNSFIPYYNSSTVETPMMHPPKINPTNTNYPKAN